MTLSLVAIGGGTGTATVLQALKAEPRLTLTAIVAVSDSGGSTGRLRRDFHTLPFGDLRQCLAALATGPQASLIQALLSYRFIRGEGLVGHSLGNLLLTAASDLTTSPTTAMTYLANLLGLAGRVLPVSEQATDLVINYRDGHQVIGEDNLNFLVREAPIANITLQPKVALSPIAREALLTADLIVLGPGDLYASLLANVLVDGFAEALSASRGRLIYLANLTTCPQQTNHLTGVGHLQELIKYCRRQPDFVVVNSADFSQPTLEACRQLGHQPLVDDFFNLDSSITVIRAPLLADHLASTQLGDPLVRNLVRHDQQALLQVISQITNLD